ncbi:MAG: OmpA family protein [Desulfuromonadales bacterium]|nr:OmpA family protein [Desulfuromonadales bacterium]
MHKLLSISLLCLLLLAGAVGPAQAKLFLSVYATGGEHNFANEQDLNADPLAGFKLSLDFENPKTALDFSLEGTFNQFTAVNQLDQSTADATVARLDVIYPLLKKTKWRPFLTVGIGRLFFEGDENRPQDEDIVAYGGGLKYLLTEYLTLRADARHELYFNRDDGNIDNYEYTASVGYTFGKRKPKPKPKAKPKQEAAPAPPPEPKVSDDDDEDGVKNPADRCPGTPPGIKVDATGCAELTEGQLPVIEEVVMQEPEPIAETVPAPEPAPVVEEVPPPAEPEPAIEPEQPSVLDLFGEGIKPVEQPEKTLKMPVPSVPAPAVVAQPMVIAITEELPQDIVLPDAITQGGEPVVISECSGQQPLNIPAPGEEQQQAEAPLAADSVDQKKAHAPAASFAFGTAVLSPEAKEVLRKLFRQIQERELQFSLRVEGHTDSIGSETYNDWLSLRRAESVASFLKEEKKIEPDQVSVVGCGERVPLATNETEEGRRLNRRFELIFMPRQNTP